MKQADRHWGWLAVGLTALTALRLWVCASFELIGDEAYYWQWSRHLDWCYYSKGPLVAWTIRLGTLLFGDTPLGIRFFSVMIGTGTLLMLYWLARQLFSRRVALWSVVLAACTPLFVVGSLLMTIDPLFIFFWLAATCLFWKAKATDHITPWLLTGLLIGIGMLAKYTNIALLPSFALFLFWSKHHRLRLRQPGFWLMSLTALACLLPVVIWNAQHDWITLTHLQERGALDRAWHFSISEFTHYLGGQLGAYFPFFFIGILISLAHPRMRRRAPDAYRFVLSLSVPLLVIYTILAFNDAGEANWTAAAILSALPLLAATWCTLSQTHRAARLLAWISLPPAILLATLILLAPAIPIPGVEPLLYRIRGWSDLAEKVEQFQETHNIAFIIGGHYQTASLLSFYMTDHPATFIVNRERIQNQYSFWPTYGDDAIGQNALFVSRHADLPFELHEQFETVEPTQEIWSHWRGQPVRKYFLTPCRGYRGQP